MDDKISFQMKLQSSTERHQGLYGPSLHGPNFINGYNGQTFLSWDPDVLSSFVCKYTLRKCQG
jgi:hypothetical protein